MGQARTNGRSAGWTVGRLRRVWPTILSLGLFVVTPASVDAQADTPDVFAALEGEWVGTGTLMGRAGTFEMTWEARSSGFARLTFSNAWVGEDGAVMPVLTAEATYRVQGTEAIGVWIDTRPQQIRLRAMLTDSTVTTEWVADTETGRTVYQIVSADEVVVRDWVVVEGQLRPFGEATYRRESGTPR